MKFNQFALAASLSVLISSQISAQSNLPTDPNPLVDPNDASLDASTSVCEGQRFYIGDDITNDPGWAAAHSFKCAPGCLQLPEIVMSAPSYMLGYGFDQWVEVQCVAPQAQSSGSCVSDSVTPASADTSYWEEHVTHNFHWERNSKGLWHGYWHYKRVACDAASDPNACATILEIRGFCDAKDQCEKIVAMPAQGDTSGYLYPIPFDIKTVATAVNAPGIIDLGNIYFGREGLADNCDGLNFYMKTIEPKAPDCVRHSKGGRTNLLCQVNEQVDTVGWKNDKYDSYLPSLYANADYFYYNAPASPSPSPSPAPTH